MIPLEDDLAVLDRKSTGTGEQSEYFIDPKMVGHIMKVLSSTYTDKPQAVAREYLTNAFDAHIEAGQTRPVEITFEAPNAWNQKAMFRVRDYGNGMSKEKFHSTAQGFGSSSKRESNEFNGQFGVGMKVAFSYANSFAITSFQEGKKHLINNEATDEAPKSFMHTFPSDEPTGLMVEVPISDYKEFSTALNKVLKGFPKGSFLLNGSPIKGKDEFLKISGPVDAPGFENVIKSVSIASFGSSYGRVYILQGNVIYNTDHNIVIDNWLHKAVIKNIIGDDVYSKSFVIEVENGSFSYPMSRETLFKNSRLEDFLGCIRSSVVPESIRAFIESQPEDKLVLSRLDQINYESEIKKSKLLSKANPIALNFDRNMFKNQMPDYQLMEIGDYFTPSRLPTAEKRNAWYQDSSRQALVRLGSTKLVVITNFGLKSVAPKRKAQVHARFGLNLYCYFVKGGVEDYFDQNQLDYLDKMGVEYESITFDELKKVDVEVSDYSTAVRKKSVASTELYRYQYDVDSTSTVSTEELFDGVDGNDPYTDVVNTYFVKRPKCSSVRYGRFNLNTLNRENLAISHFLEVTMRIISLDGEANSLFFVSKNQEKYIPDDANWLDINDKSIIDDFVSKVDDKYFKHLYKNQHYVGWDKINAFKPGFFETNLTNEEHTMLNIIIKIDRFGLATFDKQKNQVAAEIRKIEGAIQKNYPLINILKAEAFHSKSSLGYIQDYINIKNKEKK